ncbi:hypothetical protein ACE6H2_021852 [Prunus campanulata]
MLSCTVSNLVVTDIDVNIIFRVEQKHSHSTGRRLLIDPAGNPILTLPLCKMHKKQTANLFAKDTFILTISPGIDYAFIVALIVILDAINLDNGD